MKVVILCGGFGTRLGADTEAQPKPMLAIGGQPILWHIMKSYSHFGFTDFVLCLGYKGGIIKDFFSNYHLRQNDFTIDLGTNEVEVHRGHAETNWRVTLVDTGLHAMTGARVKRIERYIDGDIFMLTYGDGVTDLNIPRLIEYHRSHGKVGTVTAVSPPSRYGELIIQGKEVRAFREKPEATDSFISGGYFVFNKKFLEYLGDEDSCVLEQEPLARLAAEKELRVYDHRGFWQCMDTPRDYRYLNELWEQGNVPWKLWE